MQWIGKYRWNPNRPTFHVRIHQSTRHLRMHDRYSTNKHQSRRRWTAPPLTTAVEVEDEVALQVNKTLAHVRPVHDRCRWTAHTSIATSDLPLRGIIMDARQPSGSVTHVTDGEGECERGRVIGGWVSAKGIHGACSQRDVALPSLSPCVQPSRHLVLCWDSLHGNCRFGSSFGPDLRVL
jgi:hypothetical protein